MLTADNWRGTIIYEVFDFRRGIEHQERVI